MSIKRNIITLDSDGQNRQDIVIGATHVNHLASWIWEEIDEGIDLAFEEAKQELSEEELEDWNPDSDHRRMLFGDWKKDENGRYVPDKEGRNGFAAEYSGFCGGTVCVEWSKHVLECHHTSMCLMMSDGRPCGDLDNEGDSVLAYCLPEDYFNNED